MALDGGAEALAAGASLDGQPSSTSIGDSALDTVALLGDPDPELAGVIAGIAPEVVDLLGGGPDPAPDPAPDPGSPRPGFGIDDSAEASAAPRLRLCDVVLLGGAPGPAARGGAWAAPGTGVRDGGAPTGGMLAEVDVRAVLDGDACADPVAAAVLAAGASDAPGTGGVRDGAPGCCMNARGDTGVAAVRDGGGACARGAAAAGGAGCAIARAAAGGGAMPGSVSRRCEPASAAAPTRSSGEGS